MTPDAAHHFFVLGLLTLATVFVIAAMRTFAAARQGRRGAGLPPGGTIALETLRADLGDIKGRLAALETMLREVG